MKIEATMKTIHQKHPPEIHMKIKLPPLPMSVLDLEKKLLQQK